jgi:FtsZ-binding cell division protein ZapB
MRSVVGALIVIAALVGSSTAEDIYRWKDPQGGLHFESVPAPKPTPTISQPEGDTSADASAAEADALLDENGMPIEGTRKKNRLSPDQEADFSTEVSVRRSQLERELKGTESRLKAIDGRLATLQQARLKNVRGSAATGGVGAPAENVLSPEEESLAEERDELAQRADEVRNDAAELRQEVEARLGTVPSWWTDLR